MTDEGQPSGNMPVLSARLLTVAGLVPACERVIDIGTDHAWLPIFLVQKNRCREAVAIDNKAGPLGIAKAHVDAAGLTDRIKVLQNDGLHNLPVGPGDVLVLAGLGGYEIMEILGQARRNCQAVVIQPQKSLPELRLWLSGHGYVLTAERLALDHGRHYVVLACRQEDEPEPATLSRLELFAGPVLLRERPPGYGRYLEKRLDHLHKQCRGSPDLMPLIGEIQAILSEIAATGAKRGKQEESEDAANIVCRGEGHGL